jgi:tetratricopeptide (TPR) repeat protein
MLTPHARATKWGKTDLDEHVSWGFGWGIQPGLAGNGFWHWGNNMELRGFTQAFKATKAGYVFFSNSENAFALAEPLAALITDEPQWGMKWLGFEEQRYDNPKVMSRFTVEDAFLNEGAEAGMQKLAEVTEQYSDLFEVRDLGSVAQMLVDRRKLDEAAAVFARMVEMAPKRSSAWEGLGLVEMERKSYPESIKAFEKALEIQPSGRMAKTGIPWVRALMKLENQSITVPQELLERYAGDYGPRHIILREGDLYYQRDGRPEYKLNAMSRDTFLLEGYLRFRLQFVTDNEGKVTKVRGLYIEGRTDENDRSASQE